MNPLASQSDDEFERHLRQAVALPEVPPALTHAAIGLWAAPAGSVLQSALRSISALLRLDSWAASPATLGLRAGRSATRQLLYSAEGRDIDLRISPAGEAYELAGQVLGPYETGDVELSPHDPAAAADTLRRHAELDALGEFRIEAVRTGIYELRLRLGDEHIVLPPFEVGAVQR